MYVTYCRSKQIPTWVQLAYIIFQVEVIQSKGKGSIQAFLIWKLF